MSAIAGIYQPDGRPVDEETLLRMREIAATRGPDGAAMWVRGNVGFAHRLLRTTEESVLEQQPLKDGNGLWITADCRIDNRTDLKEEFQSLGIWPDAAVVPDEAYILLAYQRWAEEAPDHLLGGFAFAIWDEQRRQLFCARDPLGLKPFFYHWVGRTFLFGSRVKPLFAHPSIRRRLNLGCLAENLMGSYSGLEETPYLDVKRLPGGHRLIVHRSRLEISRYWNWHPGSEPVSTAPLRENAERFQFLLRESVRAMRHVPAGARCGSLLSGGLDSSAIVSVAASEPGFRPETLPTFTLRFPEADPSQTLASYDPVDESCYTDALARLYRLERHPVEIRQRGPFESSFGESLWHEEGPLISPALAYFQHALMTARRLGVRAMLHGEGGDELFTVGSCCPFIPLLRGDLRRFARECRSQHRLRGTPYRNFLGPLFRTLTPEFLKIPFRRIARRPVPFWIDQGFARRVHLRERAERDVQWDARLHRSSSYGLWIWMRYNLNALYLETLDRLASPCGLEVRLPFLDTRLFRFMAGIPWDQKSCGGTHKILLREAMKDLWPAEIMTRLRKTEFSAPIRVGMERYASQEILRAVSDPHPVLRQMLDLEAAQRLWQGFSQGTTPKRILSSLWPVWYIVSVDQWLKGGGDE